MYVYTYTYMYCTYTHIFTCRYTYIHHQKHPLGWVKTGWVVGEFVDLGCSPTHFHPLFPFTRCATEIKFHPRFFALYFNPLQISQTSRFHLLAHFQEFKLVYEQDHRWASARHRLPGWCGPVGARLAGLWYHHMEVSYVHLLPLPLWEEPGRLACCIVARQVCVVLTCITRRACVLLAHIAPHACCSRISHLHLRASPARVVSCSASSTNQFFSLTTTFMTAPANKLNIPTAAQYGNSFCAHQYN